MANMIEQSLLCKVLDAPDLEILHSNGVVEEMFLTCKDEIHFIVEHYNSYKQMPDKLTFLGRFKDFQMLEVTESTDYLVYKLKEAYTYNPYVLSLVVVSVWNTLNDPTTKGLGDSARAKSYTAPQ